MLVNCLLIFGLRKTDLSYEKIPKRGDRRL